MSGCAHMSPDDYCASCVPTKLVALREENARLKAEWEMPCQRCEGYRRELDEARAEVARKDGLILAWDDAPLTAADEACDALTTEARRIRAQREEGRCLCDEDSPNHCAKCTRELLAQREEEQHRKHPTGDYCVWCHSQWPCEESSEEGR